MQNIDQNKQKSEFRRKSISKFHEQTDIIEINEKLNKFFL
jgi:hypothetical protein